MIDERAQWPTVEIPTEWEWLPFEKVFDDVTDSSRKLKKRLYEAVGKYPVVDQGESYIGGYTSDESLG